MVDCEAFMGNVSNEGKKIGGRQWLNAKQHTSVGDAPTMGDKTLSAM